MIISTGINNADRLQSSSKLKHIKTNIYYTIHSICLLSSDSWANIQLPSRTPNRLRPLRSPHHGLCPGIQTRRPSGSDASGRWPG